MFEHNFSFDPTHGYNQEQLLAVRPPEPVADFESFWRQTYEQTLTIPPNISLEPCSFSDDAIEVFEIAFDSFEQFRCGGWLAVPRHGKANRGVVISHGYGGRTEPAKTVQGSPAVILSPCGRGFSRSARPELPAVASEHVVYGIQSKQTYLHRGCVADLWAAVSVLLAYRPDLEGRIDFMGGSFGGGLGAMALPWELRYRSGYLEVPSFGHQPLRVTLPCTGSGQYVTKAVERDPSLLQNVLAYYDSAVTASFITQPTFLAPALFDPAVPPPGQFAVYNATSSPKELYIKPAGHFEWRGLPQAMRQLQARLDVWFSAMDGVSTPNQDA